MNLIEWVNVVVVLVGIPVIIRVLLVIGGKLKTLDSIDEDIKMNIKPDLKDIRERFFIFQGDFRRIEKDMSRLDDDMRKFEGERRRVPA